MCGILAPYTCAKDTHGAASALAPSARKTLRRVTMRVLRQFDGTSTVNYFTRIRRVTRQVPTRIRVICRQRLLVAAIDRKSCRRPPREALGVAIRVRNL